MPLPKTAGYNLLEVLAAFAISSIITALAIPAFAHIHLQNQRSSHFQQLRNLLLYARAESASSRETVTFCLSDDAISCNRDASRYLLVFMDRDDNNRVDSGELLRQEQPSSSSAIYRLRASNRHTIRYKPNGRVKDFGNIIICPDSDNDKYATRLIISPSGRPRHGKDLDSDGIVETSTGNPIDCSSL